MKVKYYIEFEEEISDPDMLNVDRERLQEELSKVVETYLSIGGFKIEKESIKLDFEIAV